MKTLFAGLALAVVATTAAADPAFGLWKTQPDDGSYAHIQVKQCGATICGTIAKSFNSGGEFVSKNNGKKLILSMENKGGGKYTGKIWRPSNDKIYTGKMSLNGNKMVMKGCVLGGLACKGQTWTRVK